MKTLRAILLMLANILILPLAIMLTTGIVWYSLPAIQVSVIGNWLLSFLTPTAIFWITIGSAIGFTLLYVLTKIFSKYQKAKIKNFFIHLTTWLMALVAIALSVATFALVDIKGTEVDIGNVRKIGIGVSFVLLFIFYIFSNKVSKIINRRIQAYENAKELNVVGRGSIIFTNILKLLEILFPEVLVLLLICFCLSWNVAAYFIVVLVAMLIPMIGNIDCDLNTRAEIKRNKQIEEDKFAEKVADNMRGE